MRGLAGVLFIDLDLKNIVYICFPSTFTSQASEEIVRFGDGQGDHSKEYTLIIIKNGIDTRVAGWSLETERTKICDTLSHIMAYWEILFI